jgi:hypothetical protein
MSSQFVTPSRHHHHHPTYSVPEWRRLLRLFAHLERLPTPTARACWIAKRYRDDAEVATALLQMVAARDGADAAGFMAVSVIKSGELRRRVDALTLGR